MYCIFSEQTEPSTSPQDEDDTPWHVQITQPITLDQGIEHSRVQPSASHFMQFAQGTNQEGGHVGRHIKVEVVLSYLC